jgi:uncharacterized protein
MVSQATSNGHGGAVRVAAMGDLHVHKVYHGELRPVFAEISEQADVLVLCGDLTNVGILEEAEHLAADLASLRIPVLAVLGNHDLHSGHAEEIKTALRKAKVVFLDDEPFEVKGVGFAGVKGFGGGFSERMLAPFGEDMTKAFVSEAVNQALALENALRSLEMEKKVAVLHYAPIAETVKGEPPEIMPFMGCSRLAETIDRFEVKAVFHGHAHHGTPEGRTHKGIPVYNCCVELLRKAQGRPYVVVEV